MSYVTKSNTILYFIISTILIFIGIIVGQFIPDPNLKLSYWLLFFLLFITYSNIYLSIVFYTMLRNNPGIKGERGDPGEKGGKGSDGVCTLTTNCAISNCRGVIEKELSKLLPQYKRLLEKRKRNILFNDNDKQILRQVNSYIEILLPVCESGKMPKEEFLKHINQSIG